MRAAIVLGVLACAAWAVVPVVVHTQRAAPRGTVVFPDGTKVNVEIAETFEKRQQGLMFRRSLAPNEGMVFVFDEPGLHPFWMKNTLVPLDMLWLDGSGRIVSIATSVPPCKADPCPSYGGEREASYVVEVVAGFAKQHNVKVGDVLQLLNVPKRGSTLARP